MLKIRLRRIGAIRQPHYRIVVADARAPRDGAFIESLGHYNPLTDPATINIDVAKFEEWKRKGAQPTDAVASLVRQFNRTAKAAEAAETAEAPQPASRRTRTASGKGLSRAELAAENATADTDSPASTGEAEAEATRGTSEESGSVAGVPTEAAAPDNTDAAVVGEAGSDNES